MAHEGQLAAVKCRKTTTEKGKTVLYEEELSLSLRKLFYKAGLLTPALLGL